MPEQRPDPDALLHQIKHEDQNAQLGRLKIFFGYAAGVGKTYAMLEAAKEAKGRGADVVIGYLEPHARPETLAMAEGLESLPPLRAQHQGITLREFDLDGALERHPQLLLVDELAHTNAEGCRHRKRYQDVEELLKAGINVYTTVNVQHLESLNDLVASITGVTVQERIPDHIFDGADQVELVDIEPQDLIDRLESGKIYRESQASRALHHFFRTENLVSLREIALRRTADRVNKRAEQARAAAREAHRSPSENILLCLSPAPSNAKVIRTAARMADAFKGRLTALFVETSDFRHISDKDMRQLHDHLKLAEQLGATVATVCGDDVPEQIAEFSRLSGVSKIVLGRSNTRRHFFGAGSSFADRLTALAPDIDIYIIPEKARPYHKRMRAFRDKTKLTAADLCKAVGILALVTLVGLAFQAFGFSEVNIITVYLLGVLCTSLVTSHRVYSLVSSILSVLVFNFFFTEPRFTLQAYDTGYPVTFVVMFLAALLASSITMRLKRQFRQSTRMAYRMQVLLETNQKLEKAATKREIMEETAQQIVRLLERTVLFYPVGEKGLDAPLVFPRREGQDVSVYRTPDEQAVAQWTYKNNKHAGATTDTLPGSKCLYLAVRAKGGVYGVVGIAVGHEGLESFENSLLLSMLAECAVALEKEAMDRRQKEAAMQAQQEQLRANLLRAISHDLRTPLTSISGNAGILLHSAGSLDDGKRRQLYTDIYDDSIWLITMVENLLSVTRIEDGTMQMHMEGELLEEIIGEALHHIDRRSAAYQIQTVCEDELIMARMDARLIVQVIINLVNNAIQYTPPGSSIVLTVKRDGDMAAVDVADDGPGIPDEAKAHLFELFYTANSAVADGHRGLGLGLALCRSIVQAHGGELSVRDNLPRGSVFRFTLPLEVIST